MSGQTKYSWTQSFLEKIHTSLPVVLVFLVGIVVQLSDADELGRTASLLSMFCSVYFVCFAIEVWCEIGGIPKPQSRKFPFLFRLLILTVTSLLLGWCGYSCYKAYFQDDDAADARLYKEAPLSEQLVNVTDAGLLLTPPVTNTSLGAMRIACMRGPSVNISAGDCAFSFKIYARDSEHVVYLDRLRVNVFRYDEVPSYKPVVLPKTIVIASNYFVQIDDPKEAKQHVFDASIFVSKDSISKLGNMRWLQLDTRKAKPVILRITTSKRGCYKFGIDAFISNGKTKQLIHLVKTTDWLFANPSG